MSDDPEDEELIEEIDINDMEDDIILTQEDAVRKSYFDKVTGWLSDKAFSNTAGTCNKGADSAANKYDSKNDKELTNKDGFKDANACTFACGKALNANQLLSLMLEKNPQTINASLPPKL